ncbi:MAG: M6 family metalloprotease domain-containing protein, partial [Deltaproteobacteria bacterium]|nr:M6 family metalloprotease domain-containing protein [Deltaproteobacteria bacterium]
LFVGPWPTGTLNEYFSENSYGNFTFTGTVFGWKNVSKDDTYYEGNKSGLNEPGSTAHTDKFIYEILAKLDPVVDFKEFNNDRSDKRVEVLVVIHSETDGSFNTGNGNIQAHQNSLSNWGGGPYRTNDGVIIDDYIIVGLHYDGTMPRIGTIAHELGHILCLPDLYDNDLENPGVGDWALMATGDHNKGLTRPSHMCGWSKALCGWLEPETIYSNLLDKEIPPLEISPTVLKLPGPTPTEYFLLENRQQIGFDDALPGNGLLIYHVDDSVRDILDVRPNKYKNCNGATCYSPNDLHYLIALLQADGDCHLECGSNGGDDGDPFPGITNNTSFHSFDDSINHTPDSLDYNGDRTCVAVKNIRENGQNIIADVLASDPQDLDPPLIDEYLNTPQWAATYGGDNNDDAFFDVQQTWDGGYIAAGYTYSYGDESDVWVVKLDMFGNVEWQKFYGGPDLTNGDGDMAYSIQQTLDGGYIVAGITTNQYCTSCNPAGLRGTDIWILKLNIFGEVEWQSSYGGIGTDTAHSVQQTSDGGYVVAGSKALKFMVLKLDLVGNDWGRTYVGDRAIESGIGEAHSIQQTRDGGYIAAGYTTSYGAGGRDFWVLKLLPDFNIEWQKTYGGSGHDEAYSVQQTRDGGYIVTGRYSTPTSPVDVNIWVLKLHPNGNIQWEKRFGDWYEEGKAIQQTCDGGYIVAGEKWYYGGTNDVWVLKLDSSGNVRWQKTYGRHDDPNDWDYDYANSIQQTTDGGYIVAGGTHSLSSNPD